MKELLLVIFSIFVLLGFGAVSTDAATLSERLAGRILLQVEEHGEAWYINPVNFQRYFLGRPSDAYRIMRELGLGINEADYARFQDDSPLRLQGRIMLRVQARGEAYYVDPLTKRFVYLGRPDDAFRIMRERGLGITNGNLNRIGVAFDSEPLPDIPLRARFSGKIVYTTDSQANSEVLRKDCELRQGVFNTCGSVCASGTAVCAEVCAFTCERAGQVVGGDRDAHGCIMSAGYSWCETKNKCIRIWEEACYVDAAQEIQYLLANKYGKAASETKINFTKQTEQYAAGSVNFNQGDSGESGMFLARKQGDKWELVFDGNGSVDCDKLRQQYGFPNEILQPNFCD